MRISPVVHMAWVLCVASFARADRFAVELALDRMEQAVLAADPENYLGYVSTEDPIFFKEQQNWAADLKRHAPSEFDLRIFVPDDQPDTDGAKGEAKAGAEENDGAAAPQFDAESGEARFEMVMEWTIPGLARDGGDVHREISFPVVFRRAESGMWLYCGEDWRGVRSGGEVPIAIDEDRAAAAVSKAPNLARFFPGFESVAERVVKALPEVRAHVDAGFENVIERAVEVKIYPSMRHLQASIYLSYVDGLSGWNEPGESIKLLASNKTSAGHLRSLLAHEYGHVATFEYGPHATDMPWWVLEGVADVSAEKFTAENAGRADKVEDYGKEARTAVERWAKADNLAPWDRISDFRDTPRKYGGHVYKQGQHMVGYVSARFGRAGRNAWLRALAGGETIDEASRRALGISFEQLDREWRATLPAVEPPSTEEQK